MPRHFVSDQELAHYRAHFLEALQEEAVVCLDCGAWLQALGRHVQGHGLTLEAYKERWGYNRGAGMIAETLRARRRAHALAHGLVGLAPPDACQKAMVARMQGSPA